VRAPHIESRLPDGSRRRLLRRLAGAGALLLALPARTLARAQDLGAFGAAARACSPDEKHTPPSPAGPDFKPGSPPRTSLIEPGVTGTKLVLTGTVTGTHCGPIPRAVIEFWQADARGVYDKIGFRLRGRQVTDASGAFRLETIVPGPHDARAPRIHLRLQPPGEPVFTTQLFFPGDPRNATDKEFRPELTMTVTSAGADKRATFHIVLDL
jgi:protocatechuate 3,4-dioxygenase beta subunit